MFKMIASTFLIISLMFFPVVAGSIMESPNYRIDYEAITPGGQIEESTNYKMLETLGEVGEGKSESQSYQIGGAMSYGIQADQPATPTLLNTGSYNSLNFRINRGYELNDTDPALVAHYKFNTDPLIDSYTTTGVASETIDTSTNTKIAQKFQAGSATRISAIDLYQTAAGNLVGDIRIETDSDGSPSGTLVYTDAYANNITLNAGSATHIALNAISVITAGMEYWIVFTPDSGSGTFQGNTSGEADQVKYYDGSSWSYSANVESLYFKVQDQITDLSDTGNNGKVVGPVTADGRFGRALDFDGTDDYIDVGTVGTGIKTVEFWIKANSTTEKILELSATVNISVSTGTISATGFPSPTIFVNGVQKSDGLTTSWTHVAVTDSTGVAADAVKLGKISTNYLNGVLDELGVYNRAKTAYEISRDAQIDNPEDAEYAIAISDDNWATTQYIQADNTLGGSMVWQAYANWGNGTGETVTGLKQTTTYKMKAKARDEDFTETDWSTETSATTSDLSLTFSIDKKWIDLGALVPNQMSFDSNLLTASTNAEYGYAVTIQEDGNLRLGDGLGDIDDVTDSAVSRGEEYGVRTSGSAEGQMSDQDYAITSSTQTIASSSGPVDPSVVTVTYKAIVDSATTAGRYSHTVTYICTTTF